MDDIKAPNACSMAERKAFNLASSSVFPVPETVRVTVLSSDASLEGLVIEALILSVVSVFLLSKLSDIVGYFFLY